MKNYNSLVSAFANNFLKNTDTITLNYLRKNLECVDSFLEDLKMTDNERNLLTEMRNKLFKADFLLTNIQNWDILIPLMNGYDDDIRENYQSEFNAVMEHIYMIAEQLNVRVLL